MKCGNAAPLQTGIYLILKISSVGVDDVSVRGAIPVKGGVLLNYLDEPGNQSEIGPLHQPSTVKSVGNASASKIM